MCYAWVYGAISKVTTKEMTFTTESKVKGATTKSSDEDRRGPGTYTVNFDRITKCPGGKSPDGIPFPVSGPYEEGAKAWIFLDHDGTQTPGTNSKGKTTFMRGAVGPLLPDEPPLTEKFPDCAPSPIPHGKITIRPDSMLISGAPVGGSAAPIFDLFDSTLVDPGSQTFDLRNGGPVKLKLTASGRKAIGLSPDGDLTVDFQIFSLFVHGKGPVKFPANWIDLRDLNVAERDQTIGWQHIGDPIEIDVTQAGASAFGVILKVVDEALDIVFKDEKIAAAVKLLLGVRDSMAQWSDLSIHTTHHRLTVALRRLSNR